MNRVLVLNYDYTPLNVTTTRRGFVLVYKGKAEIISTKGDTISTDKVDYDRPSVIRLLKYVYFPYKKVTLSVTNANGTNSVVK